MAAVVVYGYSSLSLPFEELLHCIFTPTQYDISDNIFKHSSSTTTVLYSRLLVIYYLYLAPESANRDDDMVLLALLRMNRLVPSFTTVANYQL